MNVPQDGRKPEGRFHPVLFIKAVWTNSGRLRKTVIAALGVLVALLTIWQTFATPLRVPTPTQALDHLLHPTTTPSKFEDITVSARHGGDDWNGQTVIDGGINPMFDVQIDYKNVSGMDLSDVVISLDSLAPAIPIEGSFIKVDPDNPRGALINDSLLSPDGLNIGGPKKDTDVYLRLSYRLSTADLPCGRRTIPFRAHVRTPDIGRGMAINSDEAQVVFDNACPVNPIEKPIAPSAHPVPVVPAPTTS
jgi:hypothetical protein